MKIEFFNQLKGFLFRVLLIIFLFSSVEANAQVYIGFFEGRNVHGDIIRMEKDGLFYHVALLVEGKWLHADPALGRVVWTDQIKKPKEILFHPTMKPFTYKQIRRWIGKPYDQHYNWNDNSTVYCSELIGKLLGIRPLPMSFDGEDWGNFRPRNTSDYGLSPDDLYIILSESERGFYSFQGCESSF